MDGSGRAEGQRASVAGTGGTRTPETTGTGGAG